MTDQVFVQGGAAAAFVKILASGDVLPNPARDHLPDELPCHAVVLSQFGQRPSPPVIATTNVSHRIICQLRASMGLAARQRFWPGPRAVAFAASGQFRVQTGPVPLANRAAPLAEHVTDIVGLGANKQVVWPNASAHVAMMAHEQASRNWSVVQFIREAMRWHRPPAWQMSDAPIAVWHRSARPEPATGRLLHHCPEAFFRGFSRVDALNLADILTGHLVSFHVGATLPAVTAAREPLCA